MNQVSLQNLPLWPSVEITNTVALHFMLNRLNTKCVRVREKRCAQLLSRVQIFVTPWTVACQAPLCMGFSRQEYWNELPFPSPGDLLNPRIETESIALYC